jgi:predicted 3-demethylubiquinone-9 3-methyltransferase (glyoxalase superfamily)
MLQFDVQVLATATLYTHIFDGEINQIAKGRNSRVLSWNTRSWVSLTALLAVTRYFALNSAFSILVSCYGPSEIDKYWDVLISSGGSADRCGCLK